MLVGPLFLSLALGLLSVMPAWAQSAYFRAVTNLNPAGYWPMHEVEAPAPGDVETNYGTLGALGNGYYNDWTALPTTTGAKIIRQVAGPLTGDTGTYFTNSSARSTTAGFLLVPHVSPLLTIKPPFTIEGWFNANYHQIGQFSSMLGQGGGGLNSSANYDGFSWNWNNPAGNQGTIWNIYLFDGSGTGTSGGAIGAPSTSVTSNVWYYFAFTYLTNNTTYGYVNGTPNGPSGTLSLPMVPSAWSAMTIGNARWNNSGNAPGFSFDGSVAEVAIYTNVLSSQDLNTHYNDGISGGADQYFNDVTNDNPIIYLRMNAPAYTAPDPSTWPILTNYGTVVASGVYTPGTVPGLLTGAPASGYPAGVSNQVPLLSGMGTFGDAGGNASYSPTGAVTNFSIIALFRGNPAEARVQSIVGHGTNSWTLGITMSGRVVFNSGTNSAVGTGTGAAAGDLVGTATNNDGFWHHVVAVHNITNNYLYVDGVLVATNVSTATIPGNANHVLIGADPSYTNATDNLGRQFSGQVCEVAFFTNALAASDVQTLYTSLGVIPLIAQQPASAIVNASTAFTNTVVANGSPTLSYRWYFNASSNYTGAAAMTDTLDGRIYGTATASLTITNVHGSDAGYYYVTVTNTSGSVTSTIANLAVNTAPAITNQLPVPYTNLFTLFAGLNVPFSISAVGASPLHYQWYSNGVAMVQATNTTLTLSNLQVGRLTNYCVVTNSLGAATSFVWTASVVSAPTAPYPQAVLGLRPMGYWRLNEPDDSQNDGNPGTIAHDYARGNDGIYTNTILAQSGFSQDLATEFSYSPATEPSLTSAWFAGNGLSANNCDVNNIAGIDFSAPTNTSVVFTVEAWAKGTGQATVNTGIASKGYFNNEEFTLDTGAANKCYRFEVRIANGTPYNANSTVPASDSLWHHLAGVCDEVNGALNLYIDGVLAASTPLPVASGVMGANASVPMIIGARPTSATSGADNQFWGYVNDAAVFNYALSASQVEGQYNAAGVPPYFVQPPPATVTSFAGTILTIVAATSGTAPVTNQWWDASTGTPLAGQTNATLVISNVPGTLDTHQVFLRVANAYGTTDSGYVTLSIPYLPQIVTDLPAEALAVAGKPYTYLISAIGSPPLGYQWYKNGLQVTGQTASNYTFAAASASYSVVVTNGYGAITSTVSVLTTVPLPPLAYASNVLSFGAVGYWPLQETNPPAPANMETNYGTLGAMGNAYYAATNATNVVFGQAGALQNDPDTAVGFTGVNGTTPTSFAFIPRLSPALTLQPPFTWEAWVMPSGSAFGDILAYGAGSGLNGGNWAGFRLSWGSGTFQIYADDGTSSTSFTASFTTSPTTYPSGQWHYCAVTYDGTTASVYVDGSATPVASATIAMAVDTWTPLTIGAGRWQGVPTRGFNGVEDEVAIYTNLLSVNNMTTHYNDGLTGGQGAYYGDIVAGHPLLYYRMDNPVFTNPSPSLYPAALNFGSAPVNGAYQPGIVPGGVSGPPKSGLGTNLVAAPINGVISCVDAGYAPSFNPTGTQPFSAAVWFKTYPCDSRQQAVMSHGTNWGMNLDGVSGELVWDLNSAGSVTSTSILNDGDWHFAVGVYDGTHDYLYIDGALDASAAAAGSLAGDPNANLFLGGDADYTLAGSQSYFGGALAHAAFFTNALSVAQVSLLYDLASNLPTISIAPSGSQIIITYSGTLLSATNVTGPYLPVAGAAPPSYTTTPSHARTFYRTSN